MHLTAAGRERNIEHRTSNIEHRTSNIEHRTSNIERRTVGEREHRRPIRIVCDRVSRRESRYRQRNANRGRSKKQKRGRRCALPPHSIELN
jgi:hypothetical protein